MVEIVWDAGISVNADSVSRHATLDETLPWDAGNIGHSVDGSTIDALFPVISSEWCDDASTAAFEVLLSIDAFPWLRASTDYWASFHSSGTSQVGRTGETPLAIARARTCFIQSTFTIADSIWWWADTISGSTIGRIRRVAICASEAAGVAKLTLRGRMVRVVARCFLSRVYHICEGLRNCWFSCKWDADDGCWVCSHEVRESR